MPWRRPAGTSGTGGGLILREPPDIFTGASQSAAETARDNYFSATANAGVLAVFQASQFLAIVLRVTGADDQFQTYAPGNQGAAYAGTAWLDRTDAVQGRRGERGPGPTTTEIRTAVTTDFVRGLLGLTAAELNDLLVGAQVSGSGSSRTIVFTQNDGSTITLPVPQAAGGGGSGSDDGVVVAAEFSADGTTLTLTRSEGAAIEVPVPAALRQAGGGLTAVASDATLTGDGTPGSPLEVANPFTDADEAKLDGIDLSTLATDAELAALEQALRATDTALQGQITVNERAIVGHTAEIRENLTRITAVGNPQSTAVATAGTYHAALTTQFSSSRPLVIVVTADVTGRFSHPRTGATTPFTYSAGDVLWVPPMSVSPENLFNIQPTGSGSGISEDTAARARLTVIEADNWVVNRRIGNAAVDEPNLSTAVRTKLNADPPAPRILRPVSQFVRNSQAQTVFVQWIPGVVVANGAALAVTVEGSPVTGVTANDALVAGDAQGLILPIAINATNAGTIARTSDAIAGHVEIQVTHGGVTDSCFMGTVAAGSNSPRVRLTQSAYDALSSKDANTLYLISG